MSQDRVETVRSIYDRWAEGDFKAGPDLMDSNVVFVIGVDFPDPGNYQGKDGIAKYMRGFLEPWKHIAIEAKELLPAGDSVLASVVQRGVGHASGAATELRYSQLWTFRGDRVIRLENFRDRDAALEAAGISG